jgi:hypothetical protein
VASFTISAAPWPAGTAVVVYPARAWVNVTQTPFGPGVTGSSVATAGTVTFTGLADRAAYVAWADGTGVRFTTAPAGLHQSVATPDRERIKLLEDQAGTGSGGGGGTGGGGGGTSGLTVDTGEPYKVIMLADGTVRAVPQDAVAPGVPSGLAALGRLTSVALTWDAAQGAATYVVFRDNQILATPATTSYRDRAITVGASYTYRVAAVDQYGQRSPSSTTATVTINPADNSAPVVNVRTWPTQINPDGVTLIRVNASDADVQTLALALNVSTGSLQGTADPSVWMLTL